MSEENTERIIKNMNEAREQLEFASYEMAIALKRMAEAAKEAATEFKKAVETLQGQGQGDE